MSSTTLIFRLRYRITAATIAVLAMILNPFAPTVAAPKSVEWVSDAAVEIPSPQGPAGDDDDAIRSYVQERASRHGWTWKQWRAVVALVNLENRGWAIHQQNREGSSAYGLFQILRMPKGTPLREQVDRFIRYIEHRYDGDPVKALAHHRANGWY